MLKQLTLMITSIALIGCATRGSSYEGTKQSSYGTYQSERSPYSYQGLTPDASLVPWQWRDGIFRDANREVAKLETCMYARRVRDPALCKRATEEDFRQSTRDTWTKASPYLNTAGEWVYGTYLDLKPAAQRAGESLSAYRARVEAFFQNQRSMP